MCRLLVAALCALALAAPVSAAEPVTVRDAFGRSVSLPAPPQRIIPIFASNTEIVASLGLADRIVGIEAYTRYPPEVLDRPLVGGRLGFSVDAVVALNPDLVVVTPSRQAANQLIDPMERLGVPIIVLLQRDVAEILTNIRLMARVAGVEARGESVTAAMERRLESVRPGSADDVRRHGKPLIAFSPEVAEAEACIKSFLKQRMYRHDRVMRVMGEAEQIVFDLFERYQENPSDLPSEWRDGAASESEAARGRRIGNFIAGMTDRFALMEHQRLFDSTPELR